MEKGRLIVVALELNNNRGSYTNQHISITPDPPQVGVPAFITLDLENTSLQPLTITRIEPMIAAFGMGVTWEHLPVLSSFTLAPGQKERIAIEWTPKECGHRCVRANIFVESRPVLRVGRNMRVVGSDTATQSLWRVPFTVGNPTNQPAPVQLQVRRDPALEHVSLVVKNRHMLSGESVQLAAHEEVPGTVLLFTETLGALETAVTVEAYLSGEFLDGIEMTVCRPAVVVGEANDPNTVASAGAVEVAAEAAGSNARLW